MKWLRQEIRTLAISLTIHRRRRKPAKKADNPAEADKAQAAKAPAAPPAKGPGRVRVATLPMTGRKPRKPAKKAAQAAVAATADSLGLTRQLELPWYR